MCTVQMGASPARMKADLQTFYNDIIECKFDLEKVYYIDGWLEFLVQN